MLDSDKIKIIESTAEKKFIFTGFTTDSLRIDALPVTILTVTLSIFMLIMGIKIRKNIRKRRIDGFE
jgi:hypothetical protein